MSDARPRHRAGLVLAGLAAFGLVAVLAGLGIWQVQRLHWKLDLIARVEARLAAPLTPAPPPVDWPELSENSAEYRRVSATGSYDFDREELVKAVTDYGGGFWVMTPLVGTDGWTVWINRGFVPQDRKAPGDRTRPQGSQEVSGLLRMSQPGGAFLRKNDPASDRWYSRDTAAMAEARGIGPVAPYFIDAAAGASDQLPIGGLTVVTFRNSHLSYALTWFAMALGLAIASGWLLWREWQDRG